MVQSALILVGNALTWGMNCPHGLKSPQFRYEVPSFWYEMPSLLGVEMPSSLVVTFHLLCRLSFPRGILFSLAVDNAQQLPFRMVELYF